MAGQQTGDALFHFKDLLAHIGRRLNSIYCKTKSGRFEG